MAQLIVNHSLSLGMVLYTYVNLSWPTFKLLIFAQPRCLFHHNSIIYDLQCIYVNCAKLLDFDKMNYMICL
jgi:hypothetical protein